MELKLGGCIEVCLKSSSTSRYPRLLSRGGQILLPHSRRKLVAYPLENKNISGVGDMGTVKNKGKRWYVLRLMK